MAETGPSGGYDFFEVKTGLMNKIVIMFNLTSNDRGQARDLPTTRLPDRALARHQPPGDHRRRLCRPGRAVAGRAAPDSPYYDEKMAKQYTEFDVAKANAALDEAGYAQQRVRAGGPDGKPI